MMIALTLWTALATLPPAQDAGGDVYQFVDTMELAADSSSDPWVEAPLDGAPHGAPWTAARATFRLDGEPEPGRWLVYVGRPSTSLTAAFGPIMLQPLEDQARSPEDRYGLAFHVPAAALAPGENTLTLTRADDGTAPVALGPMYLLSPRLAARFRDRAEDAVDGYPIANLATRAAASDGGSLAHRILFRDVDGTSLHHVYALVDIALIHGSEESPELLRLDPGPGSQVLHHFPMATQRLKSAQIDELHSQLIAFAPVSLETPNRSAIPAVCARLGNLRQQGASFDFTYRLTIFPTTGGPLRVTTQDGFTLLHNDRVGLWAQDGIAVGDDAQPRGINVRLVSDRPGASAVEAMQGPQVEFGVLGAPRTEPATTLAERAKRLSDRTSELRKELSALRSAITVPPGNDEARSRGTLSRRLAAQSMARWARRGDAWSPDVDGIASAESFWCGSFLTRHFPAPDRAFIDWLLGTLDADGACSPSEGSLRDRVEWTAYGLLRAARWLQWHGTPEDAVDAWSPAFGRALAFLDGVDSFGPRTDGDCSETHLRVARVAARLGLLATVSHTFDEATRTAMQEATQRELDTLFSSVDQGGCWDGHQLTSPDGADALGDVATLLWDLGPVESRDAWARRMADASPMPERPELLDILRTQVLLHLGIVSLGLPRAEALVSALEADSTGCLATATAFHDLLLFDWHGATWDGQRLTVLPRTGGRDGSKTVLHLPSGTISVQYSAPDVQFRRTLWLRSQCDQPLTCRFGVPGRLGSGEKLTVGELSWSLSEYTLDAKESKTAKVR